MKALLISTSDLKGGAARAAYRLHQGLQKINVASQMLVQNQHSDQATVIGMNRAAGIGQARSSLRITLDHLPLKQYSKRSDSTLSVQWLPDRVKARVDRLNPDIINLHWVNGGFLQIETIARFKQPVFWTLHDMWPFTGGCHYDQMCDRYTETCGACPQLGSHKQNDLSQRIWKRKAKAWGNTNLTVVALSSWLAKCAKSSALFKEKRVEIIPNGLDTNLYRPIERQIARNLLRLPQDRQLVLFGALKATGDKRKGFHLLQPALQELAKSGWRDQLELVIFGASQSDSSPEFGLKTHYLDTLNDDLSLALAYSAADVFVLPSVQENLANTVMEALACGTPCVAFDIGGMPDMIEHHQNGYLAQPYKIDDLAQGVTWVLENPERHQKLSDRAREKVDQEFTLEIQARRYKALFEGSGL
ncbi:MAG: glycosyltransferase family 4 protein [Cyanobacteria bacterium J06635_15]